MNPTHQEAVTAAKSGVTVIPINPATGTESKRPAIRWKQYQTTPPTQAEINQWFQEDNHGLGIICGTVSGNLEMIELEGRAAHHAPTLADLAKHSGLEDLWQKLITGWVETTPSGGMHFYLRTTEPVGRNTVLARNQNREVLAETRGEGGYSVIAPTDGRYHETGNPWTRLYGGPTTLPTLTTEEREALHHLFQTLNEYQPPQAQQPKLPTPTAGNVEDGETPGDDYENKTTWAQILTGWTHVYTLGDTVYWRRPGKNTGISATTGRDSDRDRLYVFTTSTEFEPETPYTKFGAYALLNHAGDHSAAARELRRQGYGKDKAIVFDLPQTPSNVVPLPQKQTDTNQDATETVQEGNTLATVTPMPARSYEHTEDYDALSIVHQHQTRIAYVPEQAKWLCWDGSRWEWQPTGGGKIRELIRTYIRQLPEDTEADRKYKKRVLTNTAVTNRLNLSSTDQRIVVTQDRLDQHPWELNTPGGIINLRDGSLLESDPMRYHTKQTRTAPDPDMNTPQWDAFLDKTFAGDVELMGFMQRLAGYSATGVVTEHVLPFLYGSGGNGKSVFVDTMVALLGDYAAATPAGFLMSGRQAHETEIARLSGLRLAVASEVNENDRFDEAKVKQLTGGDQLTARFMHQDHFTFTPTHKLWMMGNHQPRVTSGGTSFWRRVLLTPFVHTVPKHEMIDGLTQKLIDEEGPGILNWIITGAVLFHATGLQPPTSVTEASATYAEEEDSLKRFIVQNLKFGGGDHVTTATADVRAAYMDWCRAEGETPITPQAFGRELKNRFNLDQKRIMGKRYYTNITLLNVGDEMFDLDDAWNDLGGGR